MSTAASPPVSDAGAVVVMGVSGSGKTSVGRILAQALRVDFVDGDDLHSDEARAKMSRGIALVDEDRWPWLDRVGARLSKGSVVIACSALKRSYRDRLRAGAGPCLKFVYLSATPEAMRARVASRKGHYMPASLVDSQFSALEPPEAESDVVTLAADAALPDAALALIPRLEANASTEKAAP
jgi:gluconokinase